MDSLNESRLQFFPGGNDNLVYRSIALERAIRSGVPMQHQAIVSITALFAATLDTEASSLLGSLEGQDKHVMPCMTLPLGLAFGTLHETLVL